MHTECPSAHKGVPSTAYGVLVDVVLRQMSGKLQEMFFGLSAGVFGLSAGVFGLSASMSPKCAH